MRKRQTPSERYQKIEQSWQQCSRRGMFHYVFTRGLAFLPCIAAYAVICFHPILKERHLYWIAAIILIVFSFGLATVRYVAFKTMTLGRDPVMTCHVTPND